ncbi:MAG: cupin domain-containing protein [bacterium]|nr:cupin domain-containing protein [bacterium]
MNTYAWDTIPATEVRPGVTRKVFTGEGSMLVMTEVHPGANEAPHTHPFEQLVFVVEGNANFTLGEKKIAIAAGSVFRVPPETPHGAEVTSKGPCRLLAVYGPRREDYLIHCEYQEK